MRGTFALLELIAPIGGRMLAAGMGRGTLPLVCCLAVVLSLAGCELTDEPEQSHKPPREALVWTCGDFQSASSVENAEAIASLAGHVSAQTGKPVGEGKKVQAAIDRLCASAPADEIVGVEAVNAVAAGGEDPQTGESSAAPPPETPGGGPPPTNTSTTSTTSTTSSTSTTTSPAGSGEIECQDGVDNDGDGRTDWPDEKDYGCYYAEDPTEY